MDKNKIRGCILALALGDAMGAAYEGGVFEQAAWKVLGTNHGKKRWTDDTQMSIDIVESLIHCGKVDPDHLAHRFARSYQWSRGYGPGAAKILKNIKKGMPWAEANRSVYKEGSLGNGAAMRAAPVGIFYSKQSRKTLRKAAEQTALITHAHPLGIEGAVLIAQTSGLAMMGSDVSNLMGQLKKTSVQWEFKTKLDVAAQWLQKSIVQDVTMVRSELGNGIAAQDSVVTAIYCALSHLTLSFEQLLYYIRTLDGDVDTVGAMAGAIWGAANGAGALPESLLNQLEQLPYLEQLIGRFSVAIAAQERSMI